MDAIEKRARFEEWAKAKGLIRILDGGRFESSSLELLFEAFAQGAALAPPEGYVLVNHTQLRQLLRDVVTATDFVGGRAQSKPLARRLADQAWALIESPVGAARAEVP
ncbi:MULTISPECIES: hypothetical protein [Stenotrophomonas]|uniref:hypothetical protein n=1 Tax=Stenotrophomonas TaxID=40323 RepID=UPI000B6E1134|nr:MULTISPECIES: hypothetical protein [Stenotrophomonas]SMR69296.1 hypothetical protein SAMN04487863_0276 [Stenotrophomonas sp. yr243]SNT57921.1 hypothetical protein SAMN05518671_3637 [Stenotrophomonas lactitubi]